MRRVVLSIALVLFSTSVLFGADDSDRWHALSADPPGAPARLAGVTPLPDGIDLRVEVPGLSLRTVQTKTGPRDTLQIPAAGVTGAAGEPRLPALRFTVEVPPGAGVVLELAVESISELPLGTFGIVTPLLPVQLPVAKLEGAGDLVPFVEDAATYGRDAFFPAERAVVVDRAVLRGRHVALIEVRPVRYNPVSGTLEVWSAAELRIGFEGGRPAVASREKGRLASPSLDPWLAREIEAAAGSTGSVASPAAGGAGEGAAGMLVVVYDDFLDAVQPLIDWKRRSGFKVEVVRTSDLGTSPNDADVKAAIEQRYLTWSAPSLEYVLLVGDTDYCPIHTGNGGGSSQVTDNWYACVDGTDYLPDLAIARISTRSAAETTDVVDKLMTYERATFLTDDWVKKAGFIGTSDGGYIGLIEGTHDWAIDNYYTPNGYQPTPWSHGHASCDRHYNSYDADTAEIAASINEGRSIVNYSGHGSNTSWQGPTSHGGYGQSDVLANTNDGMYPFVISNACITGTLANTECFGETWQKAPNKGAIAFWGASNNSYWDEDDVLERDLHDNIFPMDSTPPIGVIVNETKIDLWDYYGDVSSVAYYFDMYNLLSEPSLSLWTRVPRELTVSYPQAHPIGESSFAVTVLHEGQPVAGALVAIMKADEGVFEAGHTDATGSVTLLLDPAPESVGTMLVTVTGHDLLPFESSSEVISPDSPWLIHRSHTADDSAGDGDGQANPGEEIVFAVTVENVGEQPGQDLAATLTTSTPQWCTVLDGSASFPDLDPQEMGESLPDHFRIQVSPGAPDGVMLGFDLGWTAAGGASGTTSFSEQVATVALALDGFAIDDTIQGNGNGVAGPGETVEMEVTLANIGHRDATGIGGVLTTGSPHITIVEDSVGYDDIAAGATGESQPPLYRFAVAPDAPDQQPVTFTLTVDEQGSGYSNVILFDVMISSCGISGSTDVGQAIQDYETVESELFYPYAVQIDEVNAFVDISHTYIGDLEITLVSPEGTTCLLHDRSGSSTNDISTWYDEETQPVESMTKFIGENAFGSWRLIVTDHAGADTGSLDAWMLEMCGQGLAPVPTLAVAGHGVDDAGACNPDGVADVGEIVSMEVNVRNVGWGEATGVRATLSSTANVAVLGGPVNLPDLAQGEETPAVFDVLVGAVGCPEEASFTVAFEANEGQWFDGFTDVLEADLEVGELREMLEHAGAEPAGWTHSSTIGNDDWQIVNDRDHNIMGQYSWFASGAASVKDDRLVSPPLYVGGAAIFRFWHWVDLENGADGGVLEISEDGGWNWSDLGAQIQGGGYDAPLTGSNPIAGRQAWTGFQNQWREAVVDLDPWNGKTVQLRWRLACDADGAANGWWVDDITFDTLLRVCDTQPCGIPGEVQITDVSKADEGVLLEWLTDPVCLEFRVWRSTDPTAAGSFVDVTSEDADPTDADFLDASGHAILYWIIQGHGPDGDGVWGHFDQ